MMKILLTLLLAGLMAGAASAATITVDANDPTPGDTFTNAGAVSTNLLTPGAALGSSGWYYNNVRNNGCVGIQTTLPYDGDGSVWFNLTQGPSGSTSKADIEYYDVVGGVPQSLGTLGNLTSLSYSWYREDGGTASDWLMPLLRLYVSSPDGTKTGYLCFERVYQDAFGNEAAPTDQWETDNIVAGDYRLWASGSTLPNIGDYYGNNVTLSSWQADYGNYKVLGISAGCGSGWGTFTGAVDDITVGFCGASTTYNFECVPEPGALALLAAGGLTALAAAWMRRRRAVN
jgi:hypothetical protein